MTDLAGRTLLITRAEGDAEAWAEVIEARGGRAVHLACIRCEDVADPGVAASLRGALEDSGWLAVTSARGVETVARLLDGPPPTHVHVAAVGPATRAAAERFFGRCDLVPEGGTGAALAEALLARLTAEGDPSRARVVAAAADRAEHHLERVLEPAGVWVTRVAVYRTVPAPPRTKRAPLDDLGLDAILLASPSAAQGLVHQVHVPAGARVLSIGPSTTRACRQLGLAAEEAARPDLESLLDLVR